MVVCVLRKNKLYNYQWNVETGLYSQRLLERSQEGGHHMLTCNSYLTDTTVLSVSNVFGSRNAKDPLSKLLIFVAGVQEPIPAVTGRKAGYNCAA